MRIPYIILGILALLVGLAFFFPEAAQGDGAQMRILYLGTLLLLVGSGITLQRTNRAQNIKNAAIWVAIIAALTLAYELLAKMSG